MHTMPSGIRSSSTRPTVIWTGCSVAAIAAGVGASPSSGVAGSLLIENPYAGGWTVASSGRGEDLTAGPDARARGTEVLGREVSHQVERRGRRIGRRAFAWAL